MRELPNDRSDFARKQGAPADHTEKTGGIPYYLRWMMEKAREHQRDLFMCFIDYKKDSVSTMIDW